MKAIVIALACVLLAASPPSHPRVVALVPSFVEDLFAIGAGPQVVGVPVYSENVAGTKGLPVVADFSSVDTEKIVVLHPDVVLGIPAQARLVEPLQRAGINVVLVSDDGYADIFTDITVAGDISGHAREAGELAARLVKETDAIVAQTKEFKRAPSVFVVLGTGPIWTVGAKSYIAHLIELAGGRNAANDLGSAYGQYSAEALLRAQPDVIVTDPSVHLDAVLGDEPWRSLTAVRRGRVYTV
ncbi:MAG: ABC transporter substrate-binding protein, partial [Candidatus Eremiobacteraeota bacterium]|nr:ABC transporter substrate-binding protein [Candidatus Eremiobacteraeota bacterium]